MGTLNTGARISVEFEFSLFRKRSASLLLLSVEGDLEKVGEKDEEKEEEGGGEGDSWES